MADGKMNDDEALESTTVLQCRESFKLHIPGGVENVKRAWWGDTNQPWQLGDGIGVLCTDIVVERMRNSRDSAVVASNSFLGVDPAPGIGKHLLVETFNAVPASECEDPQNSFPRLFDSAEEVSSSPRWIAFVRHAQAYHNVDSTLLNTCDNALTAEGEQQAIKASSAVAGAALRAADLVITSPLTRALQTTRLLLGDDGESVRVRVDAAGTERWSAPCDEGRPKSELFGSDLLPGESWRNWEGWDTLPEKWWPDSGEDAWARREAFIAMVKQLPEDRIAFVGHGGFWEMVTGRYIKNCDTVFCDRSMSSAPRPG